MTNTVLNVPRKLLERASNLAFQTQHYPLHEELRALLSAPSPAGVDGLEVVGYVSQDDIKWQGDCTLRLKPYSDYVIQLCRLSDAQAIIDGLRGENERIRLNIAEYNEAISCYQSERDTLRQQIADARDEITQHSNDLALAYMKGGADMRQQRDRLAQILRDLVPGCKWRIMRPRIDAALAEIDNGN